MNDPVAAYFEKLPQIYKCQFVQKAYGANFCFQKRLTLACELAGAPVGQSRFLVKKPPAAFCYARLSR
jgi:hypothetical protein